MPHPNQEEPREKEKSTTGKQNIRSYSSETPAMNQRTGDPDRAPHSRRRRGRCRGGRLHLRGHHGPPCRLHLQLQLQLRVRVQSNRRGGCLGVCAVAPHIASQHRGRRPGRGGTEGRNGGRAIRIGLGYVLKGERRDRIRGRCGRR